MSVLKKVDDMTPYFTSIDTISSSCVSTICVVQSFKQFGESIKDFGKAIGSFKRKFPPLDLKDEIKDWIYISKQEIKDWIKI